MMIPKTSRKGLMHLQCEVSALTTLYNAKLTLNCRNTNEFVVTWSILLNKNNASDGNCDF